MPGMSLQYALYVTNSMPGYVVVTPGIRPYARCHVVVVLVGPSIEDYWHVRRGVPFDTCFAVLVVYWYLRSRVSAYTYPNLDPLDLALRCLRYLTCKQRSRMLPSSL